MNTSYKDYLIDLENDKKAEQCIKCEYCEKYYMKSYIDKHIKTKKCKHNKYEKDKLNVHILYQVQ